MIELCGITWDHSRGFDPVQATAKQYMAANPDVRVTWERRTLTDFAELSVLDLAERYDMIVLDHPWIGAAVARGSLLPLDTLLDPAYVDDQLANSVGPSARSYLCNDHLWALPVDAAAQVSCYRPDLLEQVGVGIPRTWDEVFALAERAPGRVGIALMHVDTVPTFVSLAANSGEAPMTTPDHYVSRKTGRAVLDWMRRFIDLFHPESIGWNPPALLERMSTTDEVMYCPLAFGYSNYARPGYRPKRVRFTNIPLGIDDLPSGAILGGAGLALSSRCREPEAAAHYAAYVASPLVQRTIYFDNAGQPGHRGAWLDDEVNQSSSGFFADTLATLDNAYLRPRHDGYIRVQDEACLLLHSFLKDGGDPDIVLDRMDTLFQQSLEETVK